MKVLEQSQIGQQIKAQRRAHGMSLREISDRTGISVSTLSKIENDLVELSYTRMIAISEAIGINLTELVSGGRSSPAETAPVTARRSVTKSGEGLESDAKNYVYEYLNVDISRKSMIPSVATVKARTLEDYGELAQHKGEEFVIVLEGEVELHTQHYAPMKLSRGDSVYIDSTMPHAMISVSKELARILFVCTHAIPDEAEVPDEKSAEAIGHPGKPQVQQAAKRAPAKLRTD